jgi:hypothetical protein
MPALRAGIVLCVLISLVIHAAILMLAELGAPSRFKVHVPATVIRLSLLAAGDGPSAGPERPGDAAARGTRAFAVAGPSAKTNTGGSAAVKESEQSQNGHRDAAQVAKDAGAAPPGTPDSIAQGGVPAGFADYIPRKYLSAGPEPLTPVEIQAPFTLSDKPHVTVVLDLFIDEYGKVQKISVDAADVQQPYIDAATQAFENARFKPGTLNGMAVRSVIKIAVEFEPL